jgi:hypothetical protein
VSTFSCDIARSIHHSRRAITKSTPPSWSVIAPSSCAIPPTPFERGATTKRKQVYSSLECQYEGEVR